jgi:hypothetical protein
MTNWRDSLSIKDYLAVHGVIKHVYWNNGKRIGECIQDVDGYWKFGFISADGLWDSGPLQRIAAMLDDLNADWDAEIQEYFAAEKESDNE